MDTEIKCDCAYPRYLTGYNCYTGKGDVIRLCCLARALEELTGKKFVFEFDIPASEIQDWDENQETQRLRREQEIAIHDEKARHGAVKAGEARPAPYAKKEPPAWVADRVSKIKKAGK